MASNALSLVCRLTALKEVCNDVNRRSHSSIVITSGLLLKRTVQLHVTMSRFEDRPATMASANSGFILAHHDRGQRYDRFLYSHRCDVTRCRHQIPDNSCNRGGLSMGTINFTQQPCFLSLLLSVLEQVSRQKVLHDNVSSGEPTIAYGAGLSHSNLFNVTRNGHLAFGARRKGTAV